MNFSLALQVLAAVLIGALCVIVLVRAATIMSARRRPVPAAGGKQGMHGAALSSRAYPACYSSAPHFRNLFRITPWEARGVFIVAEQEFRFEGRGRKGEHVALQFGKRDAFVTYIPRSFLRDGGLSWFAVRLGDEIHYFTSERGVPDFSELPTTTGIYEAVTDTYVNHRAVS